MIDKNKIAVLGGGNGSHAMAADLALKGYQVNMCEMPELKANISAAMEQKTIELINAWGEVNTVKLNVVTTNFEEALNDVGYVMMVVPAVGTRGFFNSIMPYLEDGQTIVKWSANFSALLLAQMLREKGIKKDVTLAESHTLPWGCRMVSPARVQIMVWFTRLLFATLPAKNINSVIGDLKKMYPVVAGENVLATSLNNLNPVVHPVGTVMNAGWIDTIGKDFYFYRDGNTLSISRGIKAVFEEVSRVADAVDIKMIDYPEEDFWKKSAIMSTYARAPFDKEGAVAKISGPSSVKERYIAEDIPHGLVPVVKIAEKFNVDMPVTKSIIHLASVINQIDYWKEGLSLADLGIEASSKEELFKILQECL